jgi:probable rRNA maturation factor
MKLNLINQSQHRMPRKFILDLLVFLTKPPASKKTKGRSPFVFRFKDNQELTIVFLTSAAAKKLNSQFRGRNYATDILSFPGVDASEIGELALCPEVLCRQTVEHEHSFRAELAYMIIHGLLHLQGYDHEGEGPKAQVQAKRMFKVQDQLFDRVRDKYDF